MLQQTCRTCATLFDENTILIPAFEQIVVTTKTNNEFHLASEITALNIKIEQNDGLPQQVCINCVKQLTNIHNFRQLCRRSQMKLKESFKIEKFEDNFREFECEIYSLECQPESTQLPDETTENETKMISSNVENLGEVKSLLENSDSFKTIEESSTIEQIDDITEALSEDRQGIHIIFNEDDELNASVEYLDDMKCEDETLIDDHAEDITMDGLQSEESQSNEEDEEALSVMMCPKCKHYVYSSRLKLDQCSCIQLLKLKRIPEITSELEFHCFYCNKIFQSIEIIADHIIKTHPIKNPFQCKFCDEHFQTSSKRKAHVEKMHKKEEISKPVKCNLCDKIFKGKHEVHKHSKVVHPDGDYECQFCSRKFINAHKFNYHLKSHDKSKQFQCRYCDKSFIQNHHLQFHEESHPDTPKSYKCEKCGKGFIHRLPYQAHLKKHETNLPFVCDVCGRSYRVQFMLNHHKRLHSYDYQCEMCGKRYNTKATLDLHRLSHNPGEEYELEKNSRRKYYEKQQLKYGKLFTCPVCSNKFDIPSALEKHMKMHDTNRKYKCELCGNCYKTSYHLQSHMNRAHYKTKSFDCSVCGKVFYELAILNGHLESHKEKCKCSYCDKSYSKAYIRNHELTHTREKNYVCKICGDSFILVTKLRAHYLRHSDEEKRQIEAKILAENKPLISKNEEDQKF